MRLPEPVHFAQDRAEDRKGFHSKGYSHCRDEYGRTDARKELLGIAPQNPVSGETA